MEDNISKVEISNPAEKNVDDENDAPRVNYSAADLGPCLNRRKLRDSKSCEVSAPNEDAVCTVDSDSPTKEARHFQSCDEGCGKSTIVVPQAVVRPLKAADNLCFKEEEIEDTNGYVKYDDNKGIPKNVAENFSQAPVFDPDDDLYMANACCECMHYRTATVCVGVIEIILILAWIALMACYNDLVSRTPIAPWLMAVQILGALSLSATIVCLFVGVWFEKRYLILPHLCFQVFGIGIGLSLTLLAVVVMAIGSDVSATVFGFIFGRDNLPGLEKQFGPIWPFCLAVVFDFSAALGIWFYVLVKGYYEFLQDKEFFAGLASISAASATANCQMKKMVQSAEKTWWSDLLTIWSQNDVRNS